MMICSCLRCYYVLYESLPHSFPSAFKSRREIQTAIVLYVHKTTATGEVTFVFTLPCTSHVAFYVAVFPLESGTLFLWDSSWCDISEPVWDTHNRHTSFTNVLNVRTKQSKTQIKSKTILLLAWQQTNFTNDASWITPPLAPLKRLLLLDVVVYRSAH